MNSSDNNNGHLNPLADRAMLAFERTRAERDALPESSLRRPNVDMVSSIVIGFGSLKQLAPFRAQIVEELPKFPISIFDNLGDYIHQAEHALAITSMSTSVNDAFPEESAELTAKRLVLSDDIAALTRRGYIAEDATVNARGAKGLRNIAFDVRLFAEILLAALPTCAGKTAATEEELIAAKELASSVLQAIGERDLAVASSSASLELRMRSFTLLADKYDEIRRVMSYLRWHEGDADTFAPSIFPHRSGSSSKATDDTSAAGSPSANGTSSSNGATSNGATPNGGAPNGGAPSNGAATGASPIPPGMPGAPPFVNK